MGLARILCERRTLLDAIIAFIVILNLWFDYYHRGWLIIDAIIVLVVLIGLAKSRFS